MTNQWFILPFVSNANMEHGLQICHIGAPSIIKINDQIIKELGHHPKWALKIEDHWNTLKHIETTNQICPQVQTATCLWTIHASHDQQQLLAKIDRPEVYYSWVHFMWGTSISSNICSGAFEFSLWIKSHAIKNTSFHTFPQLSGSCSRKMHLIRTHVTLGRNGPQQVPREKKILWDMTLGKKAKQTLKKFKTKH